MMNARRLSALGLIGGLLWLGGCASFPMSHTSQTPAKMDFVVMGDTPYDAIDVVMLTKAVPAIKAIHPPFVLHVGDTQSGGDTCGTALDARMQKLFDDLKPIPLFYAVGDNEWTDCDRQVDPATGKTFSELGRLDRLRSLFFAKPEVTDAKWHYAQQPGMPENARFDYGGLTFVTLDAVGTNNGRDNVMGDDLNVAAHAADARDAHNIAWLSDTFAYAERRHSQGVVVVMQADMTNNTKPAMRGIVCTDAVPDEKRPCDGFLNLRKALVDQSVAFKKPVFYIHGDTAPFTLWRGIEGQATQNLWELNAAGDAGVTKQGVDYGVRDVTHVWIDLSQADPIRVEGVLTGRKPDAAVAP